MTKSKEISFIIPIEEYSSQEKDKMKYSLNKIWAGGSWSNWVRRAKRELWHEEVVWIVEDEGIKPIKYKVNLTLEYYWKGRTLDTSNCAVMTKLIEDSLVEAKVFKNDTIEFVGWNHTISHKASKEDEGDYVKVTITPYEEG